MSQRANYFKIGLFVIAATVLLVGGLVTLGLRAAFRKTVFYETYIDESVQGLEVGSPVKYRGVLLGHVVKIDLVANVYDPPDTAKRRLVYVEVEIDPTLIGSSAEKDEQTRNREAQNLVAAGLRVRLASQGITGLAYLEVDFVGGPPPFRPDWTPRTHYMPSAPSTATRFTDAIDAIFKKLERLDLDKLTADIEKLLHTIDNAIETTDVAKVSRDLDRLVVTAQEKLEKTRLEEITTSVEDLLKKAVTAVDDLKVGELRDQTVHLIAELRSSNQEAQGLLQRASTAAGNVQDLSRDLPAIVAQLRAALKHVDQLVIGQQQDVAAVVENVRLISEHLKGLSGNAEKYPSQLLFGAPPTAPEARKP